MLSGFLEDGKWALLNQVNIVVRPWAGSVFVILFYLTSTSWVKLFNHWHKQHLTGSHLRRNEKFLRMAKLLVWQILFNMYKTKALSFQLHIKSRVSLAEASVVFQDMFPVTAKKGHRKTGSEGGRERRKIPYFSDQPKLFPSMKSWIKFPTYLHFLPSCTRADFLQCHRERSEVRGVEIRKESAGN